LFFASHVYFSAHCLQRLLEYHTFADIQLLSNSMETEALLQAVVLGRLPFEHAVGVTDLRSSSSALRCCDQPKVFILRIFGVYILFLRLLSCGCYNRGMGIRGVRGTSNMGGI
jgi:hypothetical protein